jgi:ketosteroid isomerase-like protein
MTTAKILTATAGAAAAIGARALLVRALLFKLRRDVAKLNAGDHRPLLDGYADDAVLVFNEGDHRWSGEHRGKAAIERFLRDFVGAGLQGQLGDLLISGPPWALTMVARFDDRATGPEGEELYRNRVVLLVRTRWGRIVRHEDFYEDTKRIEVLEQRLRALGVAPAAAREPVPA